MPRDEFVAALKKQAERYYHTHPFHKDMNAGKLSKKQIQVWVANRFYYQKSIPLKDAAILSNCPEIQCAVSGFSAFSTMMARRLARAGSKTGSSWPRRWA